MQAELVYAYTSALRVQVCAGVEHRNSEPFEPHDRNLGEQDPGQGSYSCAERRMKHTVAPFGED